MERLSGQLMQENRCYHLAPELEPPLHPSYFSLSPSLLPTIATGSRPFTTPIADGIITAEIQEGNLEIAALFQ